jgi:ABC-type nitrate/sulfonate/bicarbonate transport system permease component
MLTDRPPIPETGGEIPPSRPSRLAHAYGPAVLLIVAGVGLWELLVRVLDVPDFIWPSPSLVAATLRDEAGLLADHTLVTLTEVVAGFVISIVAGIAIGVALHLWTTARRAVYPILIASQSIPTIVLAPVLVLALGFNIGPKLAIVALFCFFPIVVAAVDGLRAVDPEYTRMMLTLDASRLDILRRVELPAALPQLFSGVRIAATYAAIGAVFAEWAGSDAGLGWELVQAQGRVDTPLVFATIAVVTALALVLFGLVALVERLAVPWARHDRTLPS